MKQDSRIVIAVVIATILIFVGGIFLLTKSSKPKTYSQELLIREDSPATYKEQLKVTIVEFGDYQCPACSVYSPIINQILKDYQGKVGFVFRHFPLPQHQNAVMASEAAEAAGKQGKYWEMHDMLYEKQTEWAPIEDPLPIFIKYAETLNLEKVQFESSIKEGVYKGKITRDQKDGMTLGINSTPTFFINGEKFSGNPTYDNLKLKIDSLLK